MITSSQIEWDQFQLYLTELQFVRELSLVLSEDHRSTSEILYTSSPRLQYHYSLVYGQKTSSTFWLVVQKHPLCIHSGIFRLIAVGIIVHDPS